MKRNHGFGVIEVILVIVIVAIIGILGWKAWEAFGSQHDQSATPTKSSQSTVVQAPAVTSTADLDKASAALDAVNVDGTEAGQLQTEIGF